MPPVNTKHRAEVVAMRKQLMSLESIAKHFGISRQAISKTLVLEWPEHNKYVYTELKKRAKWISKTGISHNRARRKLYTELRSWKKLPYAILPKYYVGVRDKRLWRMVCEFRKAGFSQNEIADIVGISQTGVSYILVASGMRSQTRATAKEDDAC